MEVAYNNITKEYEVTLTTSDLETAFKSEEDLQTLLHSIVEQSYGKGLADILFPIE